MIKQTWNFLLTLGVSAAFWCAPVQAHDPDSCETSLTDSLFQQFVDVDTMASEIRALMVEMPASFLKEFQLDDKLLGPTNQIHHLSQLSLNDWRPEDILAYPQLEKNLLIAKRKLIRFKMDALLWAHRREAATTGDFAAVRENSHLLLPDRIYNVKTDRGGSYKVRFSRQLVEDFFWEAIDNLYMAAAEHAMEAVARGYQPTSSRGASGIATLSAAIGGEVVYKIVIVGNNGVGGNRVYGLARDGIIGFVTHEHSNDHDSKYLRRACDRAITFYKLQNWN